MKKYFHSEHAVWYLAGICFILSIPLLTIVQSFWEDPYIYLELAENLEHFRYESYGAKHYKYLPGYPASIAALHLLSIRYIPLDMAGKLVSLFTRCLTIPLVFYLVIAAGLPKRSAWYAVLIQLTNPFIIESSVMVYTECLFAMLCTLSLLLIMRDRNTAAGLAAACATWVRPEGLFLVLCRLVKNRDIKGWLKFGIIFGIVLAPLAIRHFSLWLLQPGGYMTEVAYSRHAGLRFLSEYPVVIGWLFLVLMCLGFRDRNTRKAWTLHMFPLGFTCLHLWWWWSEDRFIVSILPVLAIYIGSGLHICHNYLSVGKYWKPVLRYVWVAVLVFVLTGKLFVTSTALFLEERTRSRPYIETLGLLENDVFHEGAVITSDPGLVRFHSTRTPVATWERQKQDPDVFMFHAYRDQNARYMIFSGYYVFDYRFYNLLKENEQSNYFLVERPGMDKDKPDLYRMTIRLVTAETGKRYRFLRHKFWWIAFNLAEVQPLAVKLYKLDMTMIPKPAETFIKATRIEVSGDDNPE